jgi:HEAT repeats
MRSVMRERAAAIAPLHSFVHSVEGTLVPGEAESFWDCEAAFRELTESAFVTELVNFELAKMLEDPLYVPPFYASDLVAYDSADFQVRLDMVNARTAPNTTRLPSLPSHWMFALKLAPLRIALYRQPRPFPADDFRRDAVLQKVSSKTYAAGALLRLRAGFDLAEFLPELGSETMLINFTPKGMPVDYCWVYDKSSLRPVRLVPAEPSWSRLDYAAQTMAQLGDEDSIPALTRLAREHPAHFVRWTAVQSVVTLDPDAGMQLVLEARRDPHAHVRRAAQKTLARFEQLTAAGSR